LLTCCLMRIFSQMLKAVQHVQLCTLSPRSLHQVDQSRLIRLLGFSGLI
jgi:hypothetical protein